MNFNGEIFLGGIPIFSGNVTIDGDLKVLGRVLLSNGSAANPSLAFTSEPTLGIAKYGTGELGIYSGGAVKFSVNGSQINCAVPLAAGSNLISGGSLGVLGGVTAGTTVAGASLNITNDAKADYFQSTLGPLGFRFASTTTAGLGSPASNQVALYTASTPRVTCGISDVTVDLPLVVNWPIQCSSVTTATIGSGLSYSFVDDNKAGLGRPGSGQVALYTSDTPRITVDDTTATLDVDLACGNKSITTSGSLTSGVTQVDQLTCTSSVDVTGPLTVNDVFTSNSISDFNDAATFNGVIHAASQIWNTTGLSYTFESDTASGMSLPSTGTLGLNAGGSSILTLTSTSATFSEPVTCPTITETTKYELDGYQSAKQTFTTGIPTGVYIDGVNVNTNFGFTPGTSSTLFTAQANGWYETTGYITLPTGTTGARTINVTYNGVQKGVASSTTSAAISLSIAASGRLTAGQNIQVQFTQASGSNMTLTDFVLCIKNTGI
jgi:hypothetical protein